MHEQHEGTSVREYIISRLHIMLAYHEIDFCINFSFPCTNNSYSDPLSIIKRISIDYQ